MFQTALKSIVTVALLLAVVGCQKQTKTTDTSDAPPMAALAQPVPIEGCWQGASDSTLTSYQLKLITRQAQLDALDAPSFNQASIDFDQNDAVLVTMGQQPTGGYWIYIDALQKVGDVLYVQGRANAPGEQTVVTLAPTYPYCLIMIPKCPHSDALTVRSEFTSVTGEDQP